MYDQINEAAAFIRSRIASVPRIALVLGSGLGVLAEEVERAVAVPYAEIPHFPLSTAPGHAGRLVSGRLAGKAVLVMQGRFHHYEGYPVSRIAFPVRVFKALGVELLFLTNAAGGANPLFSPGDLMIITDHINLTGQNPCVGENDGRIGERFFDMTRAYDPELRAAAERAGSQLGLGLREGVYAWFTGPSYETPAEIRMARTLGADAVGMSTVPEVIAAVHAGLRVLGVSCITNMAAGMSGRPVSSDEVFEISERVKPQFSAFVRRTLELIG
ncbi:MAG TPA: purine-nucleoside phosphorylase [Rectinemataceae bacterium]|nr:purine-nucleoside phosphorylase [Rectinemataceae bacterium]